MNKAFYLAIRGEYIGGDMLLIADTRRKAFNDAVKKLKEEGLYEKNKELTMDNLEEIDLTKRQAIMIFDGDY